MKNEITNNRQIINLINNSKAKYAKIPTPYEQGVHSAIDDNGHEDCGYDHIKEPMSYKLWMLGYDGYVDSEDSGGRDESDNWRELWKCRPNEHYQKNKYSEEF